MPTSKNPPLADDEIECGRCGAHIYYELTRCPNCGVNLYEPEEDGEQSDQKSRQNSSRSHNRIGNQLDDFIRRIIKKPYAVNELFGTSIYQAELFDDLLRKVGGNRVTAERLIDFEKQQHPQGNRMTWLSSAIQRWEHDNRTSSRKN
jgi:hypothetical protein